MDNETVNFLQVLGALLIALGVGGAVGVLVRALLSDDGEGLEL
jgi:hypothetical protein